MGISTCNNWSRVQRHISGYVSPWEMFFDNFSLIGLCQRVQERTFIDFNSILDLVLTTEADRVDVCVLSLSLGAIPAQHFSNMLCSFVRRRQVMGQHVLWSKSNYAQISVSITAVHWVTEFDRKSVNDFFVSCTYSSSFG